LPPTPKIRSRTRTQFATEAKIRSAPGRNLSDPHCTRKYGLPDFEQRGVKAAPHNHGPAVGADDLNSPATDAELLPVAGRIPALSSHRPAPATAPSSRRRLARSLPALRSIRLMRSSRFSRYRGTLVSLEKVLQRPFPNAAPKPCPASTYVPNPSPNAKVRLRPRPAGNTSTCVLELKGSFLAFTSFIPSLTD
jgi:hypothetical protein